MSNKLTYKDPELIATQSKPLLLLLRPASFGFLKLSVDDDVTIDINRVVGRRRVGVAGQTNDTTQDS